MSQQELLIKTEAVPAKTGGGGIPNVLGAGKTVLVIAGVIVGGILLYFFGSLIFRAAKGFYNAVAEVLGGLVSFIEFVGDTPWLAWTLFGLAALIPLSGFSYKAYTYLREQLRGIRSSGVVGKPRLAQLYVERYNAKMGMAWEKYGTTNKTKYQQSTVKADAALVKSINKLKLTPAERTAYKGFKAAHPPPKFK